MAAALVATATTGASAQVAVDFAVVSSDGRAIKDLKPADVQLRIDGKARPVTALRWIAPAPARVTPPYGTNVPTDAVRSILLVVENESFRPGRERPLRAALERFLAALSPLDRVALVTMPYGGVQSDLTTDRGRVTAALSQIVGQAPAQESGSEGACRTRRTLDSLTGLLRGQGGPPTPITVVFFSSSLYAPRRDAYATAAPGMCELTTTHFQQVADAADAARASFYIVQPEDLMLAQGQIARENIAGVGFKGSDNPLEGLEHLAGAVGGRRLHLATAGDDSLLPIVGETEGYYLATFAAEPSDRSGSSHRLDVAVTRGNVTVRARPQIAIAKPARNAPAPRAMLREATVFRDLPLRASGYTSENPDDRKPKLIAIAEPLEAGVTLTAAAAALFDPNGKLVRQWTAEPGELASLPLMAALEASEGTYRLRVAAIDSSGRAGTADSQVTVQLAPAGALKLSSMLLGVSRDGRFSPRLQFGSDPAAVAYIEVYGKPEGEVSVSFEVAESESGPAMGALKGSVSETSDPGRRLATAAMAIGQLPPGDYVVRGIVSVKGSPAGRVTRTLRKTTN
jgi:VWFA-related protein